MHIVLGGRAVDDTRGMWWHIQKQNWMNIYPSTGIIASNFVVDFL